MNAFVVKKIKLRRSTKILIRLLHKYRCCLLITKFISYFSLKKLLIAQFLSINTEQKLLILTKAIDRCRSYLIYDDFFYTD